LAEGDKRGDATIAVANLGLDEVATVLQVTKRLSEVFGL
jgi:hypothetical protein